MMHFTFIPLAPSVSIFLSFLIIIYKSNVIFNKYSIFIFFLISCNFVINLSNTLNLKSFYYLIFSFGLVIYYFYIRFICLKNLYFFNFKPIFIHLILLTTLIIPFLFESIIPSFFMRNHHQLSGFFLEPSNVAIFSIPLIGFLYLIGSYKDKFFSILYLIFVLTFSMTFAAISLISIFLILLIFEDVKKIWIIIIPIFLFITNYEYIYPRLIFLHTENLNNSALYFLDAVVNTPNYLKDSFFIGTGPATFGLIDSIHNDIYYDYIFSLDFDKFRSETSGSITFKYLSEYGLLFCFYIIYLLKLIGKTFLVSGIRKDKFYLSWRWILISTFFSLTVKCNNPGYFLIVILSQIITSSIIYNEKK